MLKINQLNHILLMTGLLPLFMVVGGFSYWLLSDSDSASNVVFGILLFAVGFLLINVLFFSFYYGKAKKQNNSHALNRSLFFIGLLVSNIVVEIFAYNYINYASTTNTIVVENKARSVVKKIFFSSGDEKYFISPVEKNEKISRVLAFSASGEVYYTFDLKGETYNGLLIKNSEKSMGDRIQLTIFRNGRVSVVGSDGEKM